MSVRALVVTLALLTATLGAAHAQDGGPGTSRAPLDAELDGGVPLAAPDDGGLELDGAVDDGGLDGPDASAPEMDEPDGGWSAPSTDAGTYAPSAEPTGAAGRADRDFLGVLREWMWERAERESVERELARREAPSVQVPDANRSEDVRLVLDESVAEWLGFELPERRVSTLGLLVVFLSSLALLALVHRLRRPLPDQGVLPRVLGVLHLALRLSAVVVLLMLSARFLPSWLQPSLLLTLAAVAVAVGFGGVWTVLPDVVGGMVLLTEGRLKPGQWVVGEGFAGAVEHVGPRVTVLRAADGALVTVPNRCVVRSPVRASERRWHEVEVELRTPEGAPASQLRHAIREAVLSSPYIPPDPGLVLSRDPRKPNRWRLRVRLLHVRYAAPFEGQLVERVEEAVAASALAPSPVHDRGE